MCVAAEEVFSVELDGNETQVALRDLKPNRTHQLQMAARAGVGFGEPSEWTFPQTSNLTQGERTHTRTHAHMIYLKN